MRETNKVPNRLHHPYSGLVAIDLGSKAEDEKRSVSFESKEYFTKVEGDKDLENGKGGRIVSDGIIYSGHKDKSGRKLHPMNKLFDGFPSEPPISTKESGDILKSETEAEVTQSHGDISLRINDFSFSTANDSMNDFKCPILQENTVEDTNEAFVEEPSQSSEAYEPPLTKVSSPSKSVKSDNSVGLTLIIGSYDYNTNKSSKQTSSVKKTSEKAEKIDLFFNDEKSLEEKKNAAFAGANTFLSSNLKYHNRNGSESSTVSNASSNSTLTLSKGKRFVRYAMNTQGSLSSNSTSRWEIGNVIKWLDRYQFNASWKETFRKNEISGNRFLELSNYDVNSTIWRQFSKYLEMNDELNSIERFIDLLKIDVENEIDHENIPTTYLAGSHSKRDSADLPSASRSLNPKPEIKKSGANNKHRTSIINGTGNVKSQKQRPLSYIDIGQKPFKESTSSHHKFFRKHKKASSDANGKDMLTVSSAHGLANHSRLTSKSASQLSVLKSDSTFPDIHLSKDSVALDQVQVDNESPTTNPARKSGLFSTLRKYGGDRIVKQVQASSNSNIRQKNRSSMINVQKNDIQHGDGHLPVVYPSEESRLSYISSLQESMNDPDPYKKTSSHRNSDVLTQAMVAVAENIKSGERHTDRIPDRYLPLTLSERSHYILVTKDNRSFVPIAIDHRSNLDVQKVKYEIISSLELIHIGKISFHVTEFGAKEGDPLPDDILIRLITQQNLVKLFVAQELRSPNGNASYSTASSDSKSFELKGDDGEKVYPATPQYLLQNLKDNQIDYMNFKDKGFEKKSIPTRKPPEYNDFPFKLTLPTRKPVLAKDRLPALSIDTTLVGESSISGSSPNESASSFRILRQDKNVIDFNERRKSPFEAKAPKLIPNIYASSVSDKAKTPVSATTVSTLKTFHTNSEESLDSQVHHSDPNEFMSGINSLERGRSGSFIAKRVAPPPPLRKKQSFVRSSSILHRKTPLTLPRRKSTIKSNSSKSSSMKSEYSEKSNYSVSTKSIYTNDSSAFRENRISFDDAPDFENIDLSDEEDFFLKRIDENARKEESSNDLCDPDFGDFEVDPSDLDHDALTSEKKGLGKMSVRPPIEELYKNLEKYFPNTNLDKPIIEVPERQVNEISKSNSRSNLSRKLTVSRTFSNANISPVEPVDDQGDVIFYSEEQGSNLSRRRMKTIRVVANEARKKRLARNISDHKLDQKALERGSSKTSTQLGRANTKLWGQRVIEVTLDEIDKGFVSMLKIANGEYKEFAWIKGGLIGRGSFGSVFLALNVTTGEMLAVKQVKVPSEYRVGSKFSEVIEALHKEVETMKDLDHVNIVQYLGFEKKDSIYSLFLEYVAGGSIASCMKSFGKMEEPLIKFIIRQVLLGLEYLHINGILHRDLKADNLLLEIDGTCKISDFGISKKSKDIYVNNADLSMQGTIFWMAPEVIDSIVEDKKQGYSAKVDIWSLGCVVLEMFAGKRPWSNEAVVSAIYKIGKTKLSPPIPKDIQPLMSAAAKDFIARCFTIDPDQRPTAKELLEHPFVEVPSTFSFESTELGRMIKYHSTKNIFK